MRRKSLPTSKRRVLLARYGKKITDYIKNKCTCLSQSTPHVLSPSPLGTVKPSGPMDIVGIDFLKVDKCSGGYEYILVITDHFTRYTQIYATKNRSARAEASKLYNDFFYILEALKGFFMIRVKNLKTSCFAILIKPWNIKAAYHPISPNNQWISRANEFNFNPNAANNNRRKQTKLERSTE